MAQKGRDGWADWLLERRHGGDPEALKATMEFLMPVRDRVLKNAALTGDETLLDVGAGDGLIAFGALEHVGEEGRVIFSDVSQDLLDHCRSLALQMDVLDRCEFVRAPADDLCALDDASVDAVTTRSVLIYVEDKRRAFEEFHRVLKPGGRLSIFEPINSFTYPEPPHLFGGSDVTAVADLAQKVKAIYESRQPADECPMLDFDERDLFDFAERAGFEEIHLCYEARTVPGNLRDGTNDWETALRRAPNP
ncbi:MAG TPA: methyltransferase domain-containing protein, partial [Rubrobacter sp.]|nr:methyltransferase domain-containing protein [Rubrobacter sp.]